MCPGRGSYGMFPVEEVLTHLKNVLSHPERAGKRRKDPSVKGKVGAQSQEKKHHVCKGDQDP